MQECSAVFYTGNKSFNRFLTWIIVTTFLSFLCFFDLMCIWTKFSSDFCIEGLQDSRAEINFKALLSTWLAFLSTESVELLHTFNIWSFLPLFWHLSEILFRSKFSSGLFPESFKHGGSNGSKTVSFSKFSILRI